MKNKYHVKFSHYTYVRCGSNILNTETGVVDEIWKMDSFEDVFRYIHNHYKTTGTIEITELGENYEEK